MIIKILGFMQNPWFEAGTPREVIDRYRTDQEFHRRLLRETMSGHRLIMAFGQDMFERIHWDNVAPSAVDHPRKRSPINSVHVENVIADVDPNLILAFGEMAKEAISESAGAIKRKVMACHHPNARYRTQAELDQFAQDVLDYVSIHERKDEFTTHDES